MSEEAATLIDAFDDAVVLTAMTDVMDRAEFKAAHDKWSVSRAALLAHISRIERERDEALEKAELSATRLVSECDRSEQKDKRIAELEAENARLREDAERYEYLRNPHNETYFLYQKDGFGGVELMSGPSLDDAIDEARKP